MNFKNKIVSNIKNIPGWKSNRKLLAFAVDDYGNIRLSSLQAKEKVMENGIKLKSRFDQFDGLDTRQDYEKLFDVLQSVKDKNNQSAIFTSYALSTNIDFKQTLEKSQFVPENLDITYERFSQEDPRNFEGAFSLLKEGMSKALIRPQFHGREHLNVLAFNRLLKDKNPALMTNLEVQSLAGIPDHQDLPKVRFSEAYSLWDKKEIEEHMLIIRDGIERFEHVYGYKPTTFTPPAMLLHPDLYSFVETLGIRAIDKPRVNNVHLGNGIYKKEKNVMGFQKDQNHLTIVRNCMFEPNSKNIDWVSYTLDQISAAFFWGKPAIVSSHRVNFCGHISPKNRESGLKLLKELLHKIVLKWPDVEFLSVDEIVGIYEKY